ncbi:hypothetical protein PF004_g6370 [Phytophthora fragariae]|uniref:RNA-directed DNA polymerase n=1 Tax=Phytophthora fragariae TaxID=53985 RepID=A0A6G0PCV6_9STRA|nr:hypothetical protein PF004_g6370 [Phytophthora fragariae]
MPYCPVGNLILWKSNKMMNLTNSPMTNYAPYPKEMASLIDARVLKRLGLANAPLRPYHGSLKDVSGGNLRIKGEIELTLRLGTCEELRTFVEVDRLHVHAILGTDTLKAFRAVIDLEENIMTLKNTGETLPLGTPRVEEMYVTRIASAVRLRPGGQALVVTDVMGKAPDDTTVLLEGLPELDANVKIARTLCTVHGGKTIVEVCNASTDELILTKGTALAAATVVPKSAFNSLNSRRPTADNKDHPSPNPESKDSAWIDSVISAAAATPTTSREHMPGLEEDRLAELDVDFTDSKLGEEQRVLMADLLGAFRDMFVETSLKPGRTDLLEFSIDTGTQAPIKQRPYRVSLAEGDVMEAEIQQYQELDLIRPSTSPWASPVLMIRKPDGGIRFCIDYRRLNAVAIKDCYPMPLIDDILDVLAGAKLFSTMDIASGYWNVPMAADRCREDCFHVQNVLVDLKWRTCLVYLDDCVVFSSDFPTHLVRLKQVLERFRAAGFKLKMKKCRWGRDQVAFLGHIVTPSGILPNPEKVKAVMNVARPHDLHTVRAFLGLTSYFRRYIPGYAAISAPIEKLKMKGVEFAWNEDCEAAFLQLKRRLVEPPILAYPDPAKRFKLFVDSSRLAVGACLMQSVDGRDRVIAYASKLLVGSERNWIDKQDGVSVIECWGIVWATRKFRCYLDRRELDLYTDHKALTWVFNEGNRMSNAKLARWAMELSQLRFKVYHKPGTSMGHVNGLSRLYSQTICAVSVPELLDDPSANRTESFVKVGERPTSGVRRTENGKVVGVVAGALEEALRSARQALEAVGESPDPKQRQKMKKPRTGGGKDALEPTTEGYASVLVGEPPAPSDYHQDADEPDFDDSLDAGEDDVVEDDILEDDDGERVVTSTVDLFGLDRECFIAEQKRSPWIQAVIAFIEHGALALNGQLRVKMVCYRGAYT